MMVSSTGSSHAYTLEPAALLPWLSSLWKRCTSRVGLWYSPWNLQPPSRPPPRSQAGREHHARGPSGRAIPQGPGCGQC